MIAPLVKAALPEIRALCERYGVERMSLFGSATTENFSPETSDVDCLVKFFDSNKPGISDRYLNLAEALENTLHRTVDLLTEKSMRNPIFRDVVEKSKVLIYDSSDSKISF
jgi:predicted nucleotidyltransferase